MHTTDHKREETPAEPRAAEEPGILARARGKSAEGASWARSASQDHVSVAVPFRAAQRTRRVAASVLAGGIAYRIFLWLLPFALIAGGVLGLADAEGTEDALETGGMPAAIANAVGDIARASDTAAWWLIVVGVPLLLWAGYTGAKALQLIHALVWEEPPPRTAPLKSSLVFTATCCAFMLAVAAAWWLRDDQWFAGLALGVVATLPLAALWLWVSLRLPHGNASWRALLPGALLVAIGFQALHGVVLVVIVPKLEKSTSLYGTLGAVSTFLFFMYLGGRLIVTAPILNSSLHDELKLKGAASAGDEPTTDHPGE